MIHARVRSTTQRLRMTTKPFMDGVRRAVSTTMLVLSFAGASNSPA